MVEPPRVLPDLPVESSDPLVAEVWAVAPPLSSDPPPPDRSSLAVGDDDDGMADVEPDPPRSSTPEVMTTPPALLQLTTIVISWSSFSNVTDVAVERPLISHPVANTDVTTGWALGPEQLADTFPPAVDSSLVAATAVDDEVAPDGVADVVAPTASVGPVPPLSKETASRPTATATTAAPAHARA